jgi:hypothetical protein
VLFKHVGRDFLSSVECLGTHNATKDRSTFLGGAVCGPGSDKALRIAISMN